MSESFSETPSGELGAAATWAMAAGGMVGGGIFSALGVVVAVAGAWSWLSFVLAGAVALCAAFAYGRLSNEFGEEGGAFIFLRELDRDGVAGTLSWVLMVGYVLTMSVYAFTFGRYVSHALELGPIATRVAAIVLVSSLTVLTPEKKPSTSSDRLTCTSSASSCIDVACGYACFSRLRPRTSHLGLTRSGFLHRSQCSTSRVSPRRRPPKLSSSLPIWSSSGRSP